MEIRVVLDTNIYISAFFFGGIPRKLIEYAIESKITVFISPPIIEEFREKLIEKFAYPPDETRKAIDVMLTYTSSVQVPGTLKNISPDPDDNVIIETALLSGAQFLITGDKCLLRLEKYRGIIFMNPSDFLIMIEEK